MLELLPDRTQDGISLSLPASAVIRAAGSQHSIWGMEGALQSGGTGQQRRNGHETGKTFAVFTPYDSELICRCWKFHFSFFLNVGLCTSCTYSELHYMEIVHLLTNYMFCNILSERFCLSVISYIYNSNTELINPSRGISSITIWRTNNRLFCFEQNHLTVVCWRLLNVRGFFCNFWQYWSVKLNSEKM